MKFQIRHEIRGRMRIHVIQSRMLFAQADTLQYYLEQCESDEFPQKFKIVPKM